MQFLASEQPGLGRLRAERALLGPLRPVLASYKLMAGFRLVAILAIVVSISADAGIYDANRPLGMNAQWLLYGTNAAQVAVLFYYLAAVVYAFSPDLPYQSLETDPKPLSTWGRGTWAAFVTGTGGLFTAFAVYELHLKRILPGRPSEEPVLAVNFGFALANFLFGNTPLVPGHYLLLLGAVCAYFVSVALYEAFSGTQVYPLAAPALFFETLVFSAVTFALMWAALAAREKLVASYVWVVYESVPQTEVVP